MEDFMEVNDVIRFILQADKIEVDSAVGNPSMHIPIYDISPKEFLDFAENAIVAGTKEGSVNAISNLKRALDCEMDMFFESINLKGIFEKKNLKFRKKTEFLSSIGLFPIQTINKLNLLRNKLEHKYEMPKIDDLHTYYELVWSIVKIVDLYLELLYVNGEINLEFYVKDFRYYLTMKHEIEECAFQFEISDWIQGHTKEQKELTVNLKNQGDMSSFIKAFKMYSLSMRYFDYGDWSLYEKELRKLMEDEALPPFAI